MTIRRLLPLALLALVLLASSCDEECDTVCPDDPATPDATLANIWPNEDGRYWAFDYRESVGDWSPVLYPTAEEVPPLPSFAELDSVLSHPDIPDSSVTATGLYRLQFADSVTTDSGVRAQLLREEMFDHADHFPKTTGSFEAAILSRLWFARPDLRGRLQPMLARMGVTPGANPEPGRRTGTAKDVDGLELTPMFLHGYAWERTDAWIGTYGDLNQSVAWKFLESNLAVGHEFTLQLVPDLADDVFLRAKVLHKGQTVQTPAGSFEKVLQCGYILDYGISFATDESGTELGYIADYDCGTVSYAPTVGPIDCYEVRFADRMDPAREPFGRLRLKLIGTHGP